MSKIEICSKFGNVGEVTVTTKRGDTKTVNFKAVSGGSVAEVDEDVAEVLLGDLPHEYNKPGAIEVKTDTGADETKLTDAGKDADKSKSADDGKAGDDTKIPEDTPLTLESYPAITNYQALRSQLKKVADSALVMELVVVETQGKNREGFVKLLNERLDELKAA